jgi:hypothetical protein
LANAEIDLLFVLLEGEALMANIPYLLLVRPGSPGSRLARLPGEGGQYAKTSNTQITAKICMGKFDTSHNHGFLALNIRGEKF